MNEIEENLLIEALCKGVDKSILKNILSFGFGENKIIVYFKTKTAYKKFNIVNFKGFNIEKVFVGKVCINL